MRDNELPQNQMPARRGCSDVRYQSDVISVKPGERLASVHPRKNRTTIKVAKLVVAAWQANTIAQRILTDDQLEDFQLRINLLTYKVVARYFPNGNFTMSRDAG